MGISELPTFWAPESLRSWLMTDVVRRIYYQDWVQERFGPSGYVYDPFDLETYKTEKTWLARLNNEAIEEETLFEEFYSTMSSVQAFLGINKGKKSTSDADADATTK